MSETSLVLPGEATQLADELPDGAATLADVEPELDNETPQPRAFDASSFRLDIPEVDGVDAETIVVAFAGSVELDMTNEDDLAMFNSLTLGREVELRVAGVVKDKGSPLQVSKEGDKTMVRKAKIAVHTVYVPSPEAL